MPALEASESRYALFGGRAVKQHINLLATAYHLMRRHDRELSVLQTHTAIEANGGFTGTWLAGFPATQQSASALKFAYSILSHSADDPVYEAQVVAWR